MAGTVKFSACPPDVNRKDHKERPSSAVPQCGTEGGQRWNRILETANHTKYAKKFIATLVAPQSDAGGKRLKKRKRTLNHKEHKEHKAGNESFAFFAFSVVKPSFRSVSTLQRVCAFCAFCALLRQNSVSVRD